MNQSRREAEMTDRARERASGGAPGTDPVPGSGGRRTRCGRRHRPGPGGRRVPRGGWAPRAGFLFTVSWLALSGCARFAGEREAPWEEVRSDEDRMVSVQVQNDNFKDARIYAYWNGDRRRIGTVSGATTSTLRVPWRTHQLRFEVDFLAGGSFMSEPIGVDPGDNLLFRIPSWR